jgi:hypothetical protein
MSISISCPSCGSRLKAEDRLAGRTLNCPRCKGPVCLPETQAARLPPEGAKKPAGGAASAPRQARFYFTQEGRECGPIPAIRLKQLADSGRLGPTDQVRKERMAAWVPASAVKGLFPATPPPAAAHSGPANPVGASERPRSAGRRGQED